VGGPSASMTSVLTEGGNADTDTHTGGVPCGGESRDQGDASGSQGTPKIVSRPPDLRERQGTDSAPSSPEEPTVLPPRSWEPPGLGGDHFLLLKPLGFWCFVTAALAH